MRRELRGIHPGQYCQDDGDCILDIYPEKGGVNIVFADLDLDHYDHWFVKNGCAALCIGRASEATGVAAVVLDLKTEVRGLVADEYFADRGTVMLELKRSDAGSLFHMADLDGDIDYGWEIDENGIVVRFSIGSPFEVED